MQTHKLKTRGLYFDAVESGEKTFEVRLNDRAFQKGDILELQRLDETGHYTTPPGRRFGKVSIKRRVTYLLQGGQFGIEPRYCVLGLGPVEREDDS